MKINKILCLLGWHMWEKENLGDGHVRTCARCDKQQYWASFGFPAYYAKWRDLND